MTNHFTYFNQLITLLSFSIFLLSCQQDDDLEKQAAKPLNTFSMKLNGQTWQPSIVDENECMQTFNGAWSSVTENGQTKSFYNIWAYKDPYATATLSTPTENSFELQIMDVKQTGLYTLNGFYQDNFSSYALFINRKPDGSSTRYTNKMNAKGFSVIIDEFLTLKGSSSVGIKGTFYGTLYNEKNPSDSIVVQEGEFILRKVNWSNFNQCPQ